MVKATLTRDIDAAFVPMFLTVRANSYTINNSIVLAMLHLNVQCVRIM